MCIRDSHGTICYTTSPVHTTQTFVDMGRELADMGADAIVLKDCLLYTSRCV